MKKGFVTIATGKREYYWLASNLLKSYRYHSKNPLPFAIIAEEENEYTKLFDDVVLLDKPYHSFMDKFYLLKVSPYDENIFLDADSLAYGDLNQYWDLFDGASDFSAIGEDLHLDSECEACQYNLRGIGRFGIDLEWKAWVHAGVCFIRNNRAVLDKFYNDCIDIYHNYNNLKILKYSGSYDEVCFGIAMPMNKMHTVRAMKNMLTFMPQIEKIDADIISGNLKYNKINETEVSGSGLLVHFTTRFTRMPLYRWEVSRLEYILDKGSRLKQIKSSKIFYNYLKIKWNIFRIKSLQKRIINKLVRLINRRS